MPRLRTLTLLVAAAMGLSAGESVAAVLYTAPMQRTGSTDILVCQAVNVGTKAIDVKLDLMNDDGTLGFTVTSNLDPGEASSATSGVADRVYCRFTFSAAKSTVRALACLSLSGRCTATTEAR